jgi:hypothetical protein
VVFLFQEVKMTVARVQSDLSEGNQQVMKFTWALTTADPTGSPIEGRWAEFADRTVYFLGTWGGATAILEGGDGTTYVPLVDPQGTAISKTADGIEVVTEVPEFTRPRLSAVGAGATITCTVVARRGFKRA